MYDKIKILKEQITGLQILSKRVPKGKKILGIFLILLVSFLLYQSLIAIQMLRLKAADLQFISQKKLLESYSRLVRDRDVLMNEAKEKEKKLVQIKERFIDEAELSNYFSNFRTLVKSHNLEVVSLDFKPQETITDLDKKPLVYYQKLPFNVYIKGSYFNIMLLLYKLERDKLIFDINSIHIKQESADSAEVIMDMEATIYILMKKV